MSEEQNCFTGTQPKIYTYPMMKKLGWFLVLTYVPVLAGMVNHSCIYGVDEFFGLMWLIYNGCYVFVTLFFFWCKFDRSAINASDFTPYFAGLILTLELFAISIAAHHGWRF